MFFLVQHPSAPSFYLFECIFIVEWLQMSLSPTPTPRAAPPPTSLPHYCLCSIILKSHTLHSPHFMHVPYLFSITPYCWIFRLFTNTHSFLGLSGWPNRPIFPMHVSSTEPFFPSFSLQWSLVRHPALSMTLRSWKLKLPLQNPG